ncbi:hypothetical protein BGW80DRAFT_1380550 [Lactifluus volemus]|nr:hypothetical protein BGW80DRAFT_1380550 [Lactifluus volemus]
MSANEPQLSHAFRGRGRSRGRSRGGLGKYLRARGRGHTGSSGRPTEFRELPENLDEAEAEALEARYAKRDLGTNADRYEEPDPEIGPDGQPIVEPEIDLSAFLARQRLEDHEPHSVPHTIEKDDVDHSLAHLMSNAGHRSWKGQARQIEWDTALEEMQHDQDVAQAQSDLKERLRASSARQLGRTASREHTRRQVKPLKGTPLLPEDPQLPVKSSKTELEDFLDDLIG